MQSQQRPIGPTSSPFPWRALAISVPAVLLCAVVFACRDQIAFRITTITEGRVWQSGAMPADELARLVGERRIRTVIDLRHPQETGVLRLAFRPVEVGGERELLDRLGVSYFNVASDQLPSRETVDRFLEIVRNPDRYPVLIHCWHGTGRSVLLAAIYRIEIEGWSPAEALDATRTLNRFSSFGRAGAKGRYLLDYQRRPIRVTRREPPPPAMSSAGG